MEQNNKHEEEELEQTEATVEEQEVIEEVEAEEETAEEPVAEQQTSNKEKSREVLEKELGEMKDKYLRIFAEFDNYRKRTTKEKIDIIKLASKDTLNALLPAIDDFTRAINLDADAAADNKIPEGVVHVYNKLMKGLEQQGVRPMESTGADFDAELHEALTKIPAPTPELKGKVIDTIEQGYYLNDKIIRYAKVVVGE
jgi:molecular chaperone GrpE